MAVGEEPGHYTGKSPALMSRVKCSHARGPRKSGFHVAESKDLPPALECCSSSERCKSLHCLMLCLLKPKEKGCAGSSEAVLAGQLPDNPHLCLGATLASVELTCLRTRPRGALTLSETETPLSGAPENADTGDFSVPKTISSPFSCSP